MPRGGPWFVVRRAPGKISARPVRPAGWAALIGFVVVTVAVVLLGLRAMAGWHPLATVPVLLVYHAATVLGFLRWVVLPRAQSVG